MLRVKYNEKFTQDGYQHKVFNDYSSFGYWYSKNFKNIVIWDIKEN